MLRRRPHGLLALLLTCCLADVASAQPGTLVRFSLWSQAPSARVQAVYQRRLAPLLRAHGLRPSTAPARPMPAGIHPWMFAVASHRDVVTIRRTLHEDPAWRRALAAAATDLVPASTVAPTPAGTPTALRYRLDLYSTPALPPTRLQVEPRGYWRTYTERDGLPRGQITSMAEDDAGHLWLGFDGGGSVRFDGQRFDAYTTAQGLPSNRVHALLHDDDGTLWAGTARGLARWDAGRWQPVAVTGDEQPSVWALLEDHSGRLWLGTRGAGVWYRDHGWHQLAGPNTAASDVVLSLAVAPDGGVWYTTFGRGLCRWAEGAVTRYTTADGLPQDVLLAVHADAQGRIWAGSWTLGVAVLANGRWHTITERDGLAGNGIRSFAEDGDGNLWIGHETGVSWSLGSPSVHPSDTTWRSASQIRETALTMVGALHAGADGSVWAGGAGRLARYSSRAATAFTPAGGLPDGRIMPGGLHVDRQGHLWVSTRSGGVLEYDGVRWYQHGIPQGLPDAAIACVVHDGAGDLWVGTRHNGACRRHQGRWEVYSTADGLPDTTVTAIVPTQIGLVAGTYGGGAVMTADGWRPLWPDAVADNSVLTSYADRHGRLWFGTNVGVHRFDPAAPVGARWRTFDAELVDAAVLRILEDDAGHVWLATLGGVSCMTESADGTEEWRHLTTAEGLTSTWVLDMAQLPDGRLAFGGLGGISIYDGEVMQQLLGEDGLFDVGLAALTTGPAGRLWAASISQGVTRIVPEVDGTAPPEVALITPGARREQDQGPSRLSSATGPLRFTFHAPSLTTRPGALLYRYRLVGVDDDWRTTAQTSVEYPALPTGRYRFQVQAIDRWLQRSDMAALPVEVQPDYGAFLWWSSCVATLLLIAWLSRRLLVRRGQLRATNLALVQANDRLQQANQLLVGQARELEQSRAGLQRATSAKSAFLANLSHELRTPMSALLGFAELLLNNREGNLTPRQLANLERIERNARALQDLVGQVLDLTRIEAGRVDVEAQDIDLADLLEDARASVLHLLSGKEVPLSCRCHKGAESLRSDPAKVLQIVLNLLSNAAKFTQRGHIAVEAQASDCGVIISVADTGVGIAPDHQAIIFEEFTQLERHPGRGTGLGLAIVKSLCNRLGGDVSVTSSPGVGSIFTVSLPHMEEDRTATDAG